MEPSAIADQLLLALPDARRLPVVVAGHPRGDGRAPRVEQPRLPPEAEMHPAVAGWSPNSIEWPSSVSRYARGVRRLWSDVLAARRTGLTAERFDERAEGLRASLQDADLEWLDGRDELRRCVRHLNEAQRLAELHLP